MENKNCLLLSLYRDKLYMKGKGGTKCLHYQDFMEL